jgi:hypothetical protein
MTSIVTWAAVDSRGVSGLYIASDSRITWGATGQRWDQGRKTYASESTPHVFGYWGDVLFPAIALPTVIGHLNFGTLTPSPRRPFAGIGSTIRKLWVDYPDKQSRDAGIIMGLRTGEKMESRFWLAVMTYSATVGDWKLSQIPMPGESGQLRIAGSGATEVRAAKALWDKSQHARTSRAVFSAFCEALVSGKDPASGGAPQLVGLHRIGSGKTFGVVYRKERFLSGTRIGRVAAANSDVDWFNDLFERVDGPRMRRLPHAARHKPR